MFVDLELGGEQEPDNEVVDPELDCEHGLDGEFEYVVPEDENLDNHDASWKKINIPPIDSSWKQINIPPISRRAYRGGRPGFRAVVFAFPVRFFFTRSA